MGHILGMTQQVFISNQVMRLQIPLKVLQKGHIIMEVAN